MAQISILIPAYNCAPYLSATLDSVLMQSFTDWEVILIDDCSKDDTLKVARAYAQKEPRITVYGNEKNLGMLANWNYGISLCTAPFFVKLDADDIWYPQMLEKAMQILADNPDVGLVFSRYIKIDEWGNEVPGSNIPLPEFAAGKSFSCIPIIRQGPGKMLSYPILQQGLSVMRKEIFDHIGDYRHLLSSDTQASTDTEFYFRLGAHYNIFCIDEVLYCYRVHAQSISATDKLSNLSDKKLFEIKWCIIDYYLKKGLLDQSAGKIYKREVTTLFDVQQAAFYRNKGEKTRALQIVFRRLLEDPAGILSFYTRRIIQKTMT